MKRFLAIGECMIELAQTGPDAYRRGFAGDTFNTAWYARRLLPCDWRVGYCSAIGQDAVSDEMAAFMTAQGIDTGAVRRLHDRTVGLYMISVEDGERSFSYWRDRSAARLLADDPDWLDQALAGQDILYFSGITLAILTPQHRYRLCTALARAREKGALIAFDTNLRPRLWESRRAMQDGMRAGASVADIVLPSFDEEVTLFDDTSPQDTVARYRACGATTIAIKNSGGALTLWDSQGIRALPCAPVERVIDSTAAGDSFGAGFLAGIVEGQTPDVAARSAMNLAAQVIQARGALVPSVFEDHTGEPP